MVVAGYYVFNRAAAGGNYVTVPNIVGLPIEEAVLVLEEKGLDLGTIEKMASLETPGRVIAQRPADNSVVRAGRKVYPTVSMIRSQQVPNLVGKTLAEADELLRGYSVKLSPNPARIPNELPADTIVSQDPRAGDSKVGEGGVIHVLVSDGPSQNFLMMPDLVGRSADEVAAILTPLGLTATPQTIDAPDEPFGYVLDQTPAAGTWLLPNTEVVYSVRRAEQEKPKPQMYDREVLFEVPFSWSDRTVRFEFVPKDGKSETVEQVVKGGATYPLRVPFKSSVAEVTVNVYIVEGNQSKKMKSYYFQGDSRPSVSVAQ